MSSLLASASGFLGSTVALSVAAIGYFTGVGLFTALVRAAIAGLVVGILVRLFGAVVIRALATRFTSRREEPAADVTEHGKTST